MYVRSLKLPFPAKRTFFLWGPRQTGKTSLLEKTYPGAPLVSLLLNEEFAALKARPKLLRERVKEQKTNFLIIDEIQKIPELLDEIHYMIEKDHVEAKATERIHADHLKGLRELTDDYHALNKKYVVSLEGHSRLTDDNITILSVVDFTQRLWSDQLF